MAIFFTGLLSTALRPAGITSGGSSDGDISESGGDQQDAVRYQTTVSILFVVSSSLLYFTG
jgi:hypothetical protein